MFSNSSIFLKTDKILKRCSQLSTIKKQKTCLKSIRKKRGKENDFRGEILFPLDHHATVSPGQGLRIIRCIATWRVATAYVQASVSWVLISSTEKRSQRNPPCPFLFVLFTFQGNCIQFKCSRDIETDRVFMISLKNNLKGHDWQGKLNGTLEIIIEVLHGIKSSCI